MRILVLLLVTTAAVAQTEAAPPAAGSGFTGSNACKTCHADVWMNFYKNPHYKSIASGKEPEEKTGCEGCHGPAQKHVEARGGKTTIPRAFSLPSRHRVNEGFMQCSDCHNPHGSFDATWKMGQKPRMMEQALNAESPCLKCHMDKRGPF